MPNYPHVLEVALSGAFDKLDVPSRLRRVSLLSKEKNALSLKFAATGNEIPIAADELYDSDYLPEIWDKAEIYVKGTGTLVVEYWT